MDGRRAEILLRRQDLLLRIAGQRQEVAEAAAAWTKPARLIDAALNVGRTLLGHPLLLALAGGVMVARRRNLKGLAKTAWRLWGIYKLLVSRLPDPKS
jgi:YqjK-like protein